MAKESPIKRPVVRLPEGGQLGLFGSKELQGSERHAERSGKVIFNQGSVEDLFIGCCQPDYLTGYFPIYVVMGGHRFPRLRHR